MRYLLLGLVGLLAWPIRGQLGGWTGGFAAGAALASFTCLPFTTFTYSWKARGLAVLFTALAFMWGGEISYGYAFDTITQSLNTEILLQLCLIGAAWGGIGGMAFGLGIGSDGRRLHTILLFFFIVSAWVLWLIFDIGVAIWVLFLATIVLFLFYNTLILRNQLATAFCVTGLLGGGIAFLVAALVLNSAELASHFWLREALRLRDQIIGLVMGFTFASASGLLKEDPFQMSRDSLDSWGPTVFVFTIALSFLSALQNVLLKWLKVFYINETERWIIVAVGFFIAARFVIRLTQKISWDTSVAGSCLAWLSAMTILAISKEALPGWLERWELGFTVMTGTLIALALFAALTSRPQKTLVRPPLR
ncbi:MAG: hypothetical protein COV74_08825 [Candidatus Omnitrophica bacterium CG11_big_fil_rev_8_21_14_0_20_45_26]|uniref:Uncharacterized protein n=1 Tax=Candidatus Abzuiibacterium crystallinum TaxID=1974748 RepID=A0A2H0LM00_9BACT|nr:MAG: hypothetical protein COV74_08825 [Candidatus Omnitrophica bacterium CG11_big_fil_rev_8_21_14_0_20_45_26]PIW64420.1 MAG: hypothetical protein COW12_06170 [Candidatus Omnitrophica bacterium CG12_big_fil_rev_8_21_14_0_65_45_16]